jgi:multidrug efflux pump subunit AcrA (membrane-fusion protein)
MIKKKKRKLIIIGAIIVGVILLTVLFWPKTPAPQYTTVPLTRTNLVQTVSEVGTVKAIKELNLNFNSTGRISKLLAKVGETVKKDQVLAELDLSSLVIREQEARANLNVASANLDKLLAGATASDIAVYTAQNEQAKVAYLTATDDYSKTEASVTENISQAQKRLNDLQTGGADTLTAQEQAVATAQLNLDNARSTYTAAMNNDRNSLLTTMDSKMAVANSALDYVNRIITNDDYDNSLSVKNLTYLSNTNNYYNQAANLKGTASGALTLARSDSTDGNLNSAVVDVLAYLDKTYKTTTECFSALENSVVSSTLSQTTLDTLKTNVNTHSGYVSTGISAVQTADYTYRNSVLSYNNNLASATDALSQAQVNLSEAIRTATNSLASAKNTGDQQLAGAQAKIDSSREAWSVAQKQLSKIKTAARPEDIDLARAQLAQAQAALDLIVKQKSDSQIISPIEGQVTQVNYEIGEQPTAAKPVMVILSDSNFEIEVDISESDISKIKLEDMVAITLDAFGENRKFVGQVYFIDPASTVIQDVIYYKVKVRLADTPEVLAAIKSGMTANVIITTNRKDNVFVVPSRAVIYKNGEGKFIRLLVGGKVVEAPVTVGMSGNEGLVEITADGVQEGDQVITFIKTN